MDISRPASRRFRPSLSFLLLLVLLAALWIAGGASRADAMGQVVVRGVAWAVLLIAILFGERPSFKGRAPVLAILCAALILVLLQLVPLPPDIWQALPGRALFAEAAIFDPVQPWRPLTITPDATLNAASSLIVPFAVLWLAVGLGEQERSWLPGVVLAMVTCSMLTALLQFSGMTVDNPLINDSPGDVSGTFANRNHLALFLASGCLLAPVWAFPSGQRPDWKGGAALGLSMLFVLMTLATGSRAGLLAIGLALIIGLILARHGIRKSLARAPRWAFPVLMGSVMGLIAIFVLISVAAGRAASFDRILRTEVGQDMRARGLTTVIEMIRDHFPYGTGFGSFDPAFRIHEPFALLNFTYFNHAHNDFLEIALEGGLPGVALLLCALAWWMWKSISAWRGDSRLAQPRLGSAILFLVLVASIFDYPARTPIFMAMIVLAAFWINEGDASRSPLPTKPQHL